MRQNWRIYGLSNSYPERPPVILGACHFFAEDKGPGHPQGEYPYYRRPMACIVGVFPLRVPW